jgi:hypothetical protein
MKNLKLNSWYAAAAAALLAVACSTNGDSRLSPTGPGADLVDVADKTAQVCKVGPVGTYDFSASLGGSANDGDVFVGTSFSVVVTTEGEPACTTVFTRTNSDAVEGVDAAAEITVTELAHTGTTLQSIDATQDGASPTVISSPSATMYVNAYHDAVTTYTNVAVHTGGCTYTQGWYKNHTDSWPEGFDPADTFYDSGLSWIDLYNTPPKGSQYIILAHQYMTALMNIANGASVPAAVQTALDTAEAYFTGGSVDITGVADILDAYNNGLAAGGPAHCE